MTQNKRFFGISLAGAICDYKGKMAKKIDTTIKLGDLELFSSSFKQVLKILDDHLLGRSTIGLRADDLLSVFTPNIEQLVQAADDPSFAKVLGFADLRIADGMGVVLLARLVHLFSGNSWIAQRSTGVDCAWHLLRQPYKCMVIGGRGYAQLAKRSPDACVRRVVYHDGYAAVRAPQQAETAQILAQIDHEKPEVLFVAYGAPFQEYWVAAHARELQARGVRVVMVVGGAFDMILGKLSRAPRLWQRAGLEWLYRLYQEPWRYKRQARLVRALPLALRLVARALKNSFAKNR